MQSHKLTIADSWFIEKGQVDTITRSPFAIGDEVVVCDKKHVSFLECYDGECPVTNCHSKVTVQFNRANVEYEEFKLYSFAGECPKCQRITTILYKQSRGVCSGKCPICGQIITVSTNYFRFQAKKHTIQRNIRRLSITLWYIFVVMVIGIGVLTCADIIKHQPALDFFNSVMIPKSMELIDKSQDFIVSDEFIFCLEESSQQLINKNSVLFGSAVA
ncbi:MAG: hypothetical protein LBM93_04420, partial [Oscillospiraceae bacterium]|nr:hypothetical protein [Oscillospiraceae bacterium]